MGVAVPHPPLPDEELRSLDFQADWHTVYLATLSVGMLVAGSRTMADSATYPQGFSVALLGISGSAVSALVSCLNRRAVGFEREDGTKWPLAVKDGTEAYSRRFGRWLLLRPLLGAIVAPVLVWGLDLLARDQQKFFSTENGLLFAAFMGGLLAKSSLDLIRNTFKNVFRA